MGSREVGVSLRSKVAVLPVIGGERAMAAGGCCGVCGEEGEAAAAAAAGEDIL